MVGVGVAVASGSGVCVGVGVGVAVESAGCHDTLTAFLEGTQTCRAMVEAYLTHTR